jgi:hypothetical protein
MKGKQILIMPLETVSVRDIAQFRREGYDTHSDGELFFAWKGEEVE